MSGLDELWPDEDRREAALYRVARRMNTYEQSETLSPMQKRALEVVSHGVGLVGAAEIIGISPWTVQDQLRSARRILRAKNTVHAVAEALRQDLIR